MNKVANQPRDVQPGGRKISLGKGVCISQIHSICLEIDTLFFYLGISKYTWTPPIPNLLEVAAALPLSISNRVRIRAL